MGFNLGLKGLNVQGSHYCDVTIVLLEGNKIKGLTEVTFVETILVWDQ